MHIRFPPRIVSCVNCKTREDLTYFSIKTMASNVQHVENRTSQQYKCHKHKVQ